MARGKFKSVKRGGGRNFSRNLVLDEDGTAVSADLKKRNEEDEEDEDDEEEDEEEEEEESEEEVAAGTTELQEMSRADRRALKKQGKKKEVVDEEDEDDDNDPLLANPNRTMGNMKISDLAAPREPSRREREAKEKVEAKERYQKLHAQGQTEQAQKDLARLAKIRADREAALAKRKAEADAKAAEIEAKKVRK